MELCTKQVTVHTLRTTPYSMTCIDDDDFVSDLMERTGRVYEERFLEHMVGQMQSTNAPCFIDVGAFIGTASAFVSRALPEVKVIAFEPNPQVFELLACNMRHAQNGTELFNCALGSITGETNLLMRPKHLGSGTIERTDPHWVLQDATYAHAVHINTFDQLCAEYRCSAFSMDDTYPVFVKIDVEGAEAHVLKGMAKFIQAYKPVVYAEQNTIDEAEACLGILHQFGYAMTYALHNEYNGFYSRNIMCEYRVVQGVR